MPEEQVADYVIVGAGSAGCVLANRLSADPANQVLLLEAGGWDRSPFLRVPAGEERVIADPRFNWGYSIEPDATRCGRREAWPVGRVIGGSSSINGMVYLRGSRDDYDQWAALGNTGWSYQGVLPYFIRSETSSRGPASLRGSSGPLHVSEVRSPHRLTPVFIEAANSLGLPVNPDVNGESLFGVGPVEATQKRGWRHSASRAYLWPVLSRRNLRIHTHALAHRVLVNKGRAIGVEYGSRGRLLRAMARREVIVSAGTLASPKLLMLSGIGPAVRLHAVGVPVLVDLPGVGENLQEHPGVLVCRAVNVRTYNVEVDAWSVLKHATNWLLRGRGPAATPIGHAVAFAKTVFAGDRPDVQITFTPIGYNSTDGEALLYSIPAVVLAVNVCRPQARGRILLRSSAPHDAPRIEHAMFAETEDLETLREGAKIARSMFETRAFAPYALEELRPGFDCQLDTHWDEFLRREAMRFSHPVGTCKMGTGADASAVVDPQLRVRGVESLRVADASIMPTLPSANTNAAAIMIGEKASDLILGLAA
jgi:choline dehydrogenase